MSVVDLEKLVARLEVVTGKLEGVSRGGGGGGGAAAPIEETPDWYDDYIKIHEGEWTKFINASNDIGGDVAEHAALIKTAFDAHKQLLQAATRFNQPAQANLQSVLAPLSKGITDVQNFRESHRSSKQFNFLSAISEGIPFLGWVAVAPKPAAYVVQMSESAQFYTNKILKEFRQSEPKLADWSNAWMRILKNYQQYVKDNHGIGLSWNKNKPAATADSLTSAGSSAPRAPGGPPPPPPPAAPPGPPPPPAPGAPPPASDKAGAPDTSALFAEISKGTDISKGLRKVTDDMKTHKNPALKAASASAISPRPYSPPQFKKFTPPGQKPAVPAKKPPVCELQNKKWVVEWQENNQNLIIDDPQTEQTVYMYKCNNSVLQVKGKLNSITLDSCKKCGIVFEDLIGTCEFVNCQSIKAQANGSVPTISIDKTDGAQIYVNEKSLNAQIISAKSSEMNVCITQADGDLKEYPLAEQFKTVWDGKSFTTTTMDLNL